jgi:hypothetical protein
MVEDMMEDYGIQHRISSVDNQHANARAELGVKTVRRMLMDIVSSQGIMDRAVVSRTLLQLRNTMDRDSKQSRAKALYGRELTDFLSRPGSALMGAMWMNLVDARETAQTHRAKHSEKKKAQAEGGGHIDGAKPVRQSPLRWDKEGIVMKCEGFDMTSTR